ncbi:TPR repeat [Shewanella denitrificans OS217]|uniref:TPR repeat n=2 Tax=Shewanella TaxID=22 RepID=Q12IH8_SHEDO|nr:TPR repeat [Shewanella denitrificans OS217]
MNTQKLLNTSLRSKNFGNKIFKNNGLSNKQTRQLRRLITAISLTSMMLISPLSLAQSSSSIAAIDSAANSMNLAGLTRLSQGTDASYATAYANYRLAISANILGQRNTATQALGLAQTQLEQIISIEAAPEPLALLASVYGMQIAFDSSKGATLGFKISTLLTQARALAADNPRVALVAAISAFNTPSLFGGGMDKAISLSSQAIEYYAMPCDDICWGHAEAYTWRGLAKQEQGDMTGAIADWQQALTVDANYGWAQFLLSQHKQSAAN